MNSCLHVASDDDMLITSMSKARAWTADIDIKTIPADVVKAIIQDAELVPDDLLKSERGRRNQARSSGSAGKLQPCPLAKKKHHDVVTCPVCVRRANIRRYRATQRAKERAAREENG